MNLSSSGLLLIVALAVIVAVFLLRIRRQYSLRQRQRHGVQQLIGLKALMMLLQRHRGASYGALHGDAELLAALPRLEQQIRQEIQLMEHLQPTAAVQEHWLAFTDHWQRLQHQNLNLEAEQNLAQHNQLIAVLLNLLEDVAETSELTHLGTKHYHTLWRELPRTAELIGQARVLGSGILASGNHDSVQKIRMRFVLNKLQEFIREQGNPYPQLQELTAVIETQILQEIAPRMAARAYFDLSSAAMEPVLKKMDEGLLQLQKQTGL